MTNLNVGNRLFHRFLPELLNPTLGPCLSLMCLIMSLPLFCLFFFHFYTKVVSTSSVKNLQHSCCFTLLAKPLFCVNVFTVWNTVHVWMNKVCDIFACWCFYSACFFLEHTPSHLFFPSKCLFFLNISINENIPRSQSGTSRVDPQHLSRTGHRQGGGADYLTSP